MAIKARQYECYEVTRQAVNNLVGTSNSVDELLDLAHKSQEVALNDVCHLAMEKAYQKADSVEDALRFAREAKTMGMDDLSRKAVKELIDDEKETHELCLLLRSIEPLDFKDLNRLLLKKRLMKAEASLTFAKFTTAHVVRPETDIVKLAEFRGRRMQIMDKYRANQAEYKQKVDAYHQQQQGAQQQQQSQGLPTGF